MSLVCEDSSSSDNMLWSCPHAESGLRVLNKSSRMASEMLMWEVSKYLTWREPVEGALFVFGGRSGRLGDSKQYLSSVEYLDPTTLRWHSAPDMKYARVGLTACFLDGAFFVIGGYNQDITTGEPQRSVERLDVRTMTWSDRAKMIIPRYGHSACTCDGKIYVMGGDNAGILIPCAERYDPVADKWERIPDMPIRVAASRAVSIDGQIFLFGGCDPSIPGDRASDAILMFNPATNRWTILAQRMSIGRTAFSLAPLMDGQKGVVIAGGFDLSTRPEVEVRSVEVIRDLTTLADTQHNVPNIGEHMHLPSLPVARAGCQGVSIPTRFLPPTMQNASSLPFIVLGGEYVDPVSGRCQVFDSACMLVNKEFANLIGAKDQAGGPKAGGTRLGNFAERALSTIKKRRNNSTDSSASGQSDSDQLQWSDSVLPPMHKKRTAFAACVGTVWPKGFVDGRLLPEASSFELVEPENGSGRNRSWSAWSDVLHDWLQGTVL